MKLMQSPQGFAAKLQLGLVRFTHHYDLTEDGHWTSPEFCEQLSRIVTRRGRRGKLEKFLGRTTVGVKYILS